MLDYGGYYGDEAHPEPEPLATSKRELEVLRYTSHGLRWRECAAAMDLSPHTVNTHLEHARRKLGAKNTAHAVAIALRLGLID
jgi:DNA-binding CsgD family transcriptional regulator